MTLVLGIDPSSLKCGYGVVRSDGQRLSFIAAGVIEVPGRRPLDERLVEIGDELAEVCDELLAQLQPDEDVACAIEAGYSDGRATALVLGAARGAAIYVVRSHLRRDVRQYEPSTVKKAATGSGRAPKDQVARMVMARLGLKREPSPDASDALAVAIARACDGRSIV